MRLVIDLQAQHFFTNLSQMHSEQKWYPKVAIFYMYLCKKINKNELNFYFK